MAASMMDDCVASYTVELWHGLAGRHEVYREVNCGGSKPGYRGLAPALHYLMSFLKSFINAFKNGILYACEHPLGARTRRL